MVLNALKSALLSLFKTRGDATDSRPRGEATALELDKIPEISVARQKYADDPDRLGDFDDMYETAEWFLLGFKWHRKLLESRIGLYCPGFFGVYLFRIEPESRNTPEWIWIVEGGSAAPPAVIFADRCPNGPAAFHEYIAAIGEWVHAVRNGKSLDKVIPVALPPTLEEADRVERQLRFMSKELYPDEVEFFEDLP